MEDKLISLKEAARTYDLTPAALYNAIKSGRLHCKIVDGKKKVSLEAFKNYRKSRWNRLETQSLVNNSHGLYYPYQIAKLLDVPLQKIYYAMRKDKLKHKRYKCAYFLHIDDVMEYKQKFLIEKAA